MGGEQYPVLVYGPKEKRTTDEWIRTFGLTDLHSEGANFDSLWLYLTSQQMTVVFDNNCCWDSAYVGMVVPDYETYSSRETVQMFCSRFKLPEPTFYAGLVGELE